MARLTICICHFPDKRVTTPKNLPLGALFDILARVSQYKRNARDLPYMVDLAAKFLPPHHEIVAASEVVSSHLHKADDVVLLWPDGSGFGWFRIEMMVREFKRREANVFVLNGRRRYFPLTRSVYVEYLIRRIAERFWIGEIVFTVLFLLISPIYVAIDLLKGKR
jgi:hypothetical protein